MPKLITLSAASAILALATLPAFATVTKTWVSSTGTDSGTCQLVAPCKTFQFAHDQTTAGGEIDVKDTGSYGPLTITKAISIVSGDGALAAVGVPQGGAGITINAGSSDSVILQGLVIDGHGIGQDGIDFNSGRMLKVENCHIRKTTTNGLNVVGATQVLRVEDTEITDIGGNAIFIGSSNQINGTLTRSYVTDSNDGVIVNNANLLVIESTISGNKADGLISGGGGNILMGQSTVSGNLLYGVYVNGGIVGSYGDNYINANTTDIYPPNSLGAVARR